MQTKAVDEKWIPIVYSSATLLSGYWMEVDEKRNGWWARARVGEEVFSLMCDSAEEAVTFCERVVKEQLAIKSATREIQDYIEREKRLLAHIAIEKARQVVRPQHAPIRRNRDSQRVKVLDWPVGGRI